MPDASPACVMTIEIAHRRRRGSHGGRCATPACELTNERSTRGRWWSYRKRHLHSRSGQCVHHNDGVTTEREPPERRPFRFGVALRAAEGRRDRVIETAQRAEAAGVDVILATDHLGNWAALSRLQAAAEATRLRIGTLVLNNDLRHPPVLAQELATLDAMTDGRLEIGLGAGWNRPEYEAAGLTFDPPAQRLGRMQPRCG